MEMIHALLRIYEDDKGIPVAEISCRGTSSTIVFSKGSENNYLLISPGLKNAPWEFWCLCKEDREKFARWLLK